MIVLVCGSRSGVDAGLVCLLLSELHREHPITLIRHGGASGVDSIARAWAEANGVPHAAHYADWERFGRAAEMAAAGASVCVAVHRGTPGSQDMIRRVRAARIPTLEVKVP